MLTANGDTSISFESTGDGDPVLLVMGLGMAATGWWRTAPVLAERFRVLTFDNRGTGGSDAPRGPYALAELVGDALAVLDAAGAERAHVYGHSLGGMVAQELALRAPERVLSLVLGATSAGGSAHEAPDDETLGFLRRRAELPVEEAVWASVPYAYGPATIEHKAERIAEDVEQRLRFPVDGAVFRAQLAAATAHDASARLGALRLPTLVVHGEQDRLVPPGNGRRLAAAIAGAELRELAGAGHFYPTDEPASAQLVRDFLERQRTAAAP